MTVGMYIPLEGTILSEQEYNAPFRCITLNSSQRDPFTVPFARPTQNKGHRLHPVSRLCVAS